MFVHRRHGGGLQALQVYLLLMSTTDWSTVGEPDALNDQMDVLKAHLDLTISRVHTRFIYDFP